MLLLVLLFENFDGVTYYSVLIWLHVKDESNILAEFAALFLYNDMDDIYYKNGFKETTVNQGQQFKNYICINLKYTCLNLKNCNSGNNLLFSI